MNIRLNNQVILGRVDKAIPRSNIGRERRVYELIFKSGNKLQSLEEIRSCVSSVKTAQLEWLDEEGHKALLFVDIDKCSVSFEDVNN